MKVVIITTIILILFFVGALFFTNFVNLNTEEILNSVEKLNQAIIEEDWNTAMEELKEVRQKWNGVKPVFETLLEHYDTDSVSISLDHIETFIKIEEQKFSLLEVNRLKHTINLIKKRETFSWSNLF